MKTELEHVHPAEIERRSFSIISQELGPRTYAGPYDELILKRVIHASADFDYADHLVFSPGAVESAMEAIRAGADIVTDTQMAKAGINKTALARFGGQVRCFMSDPDVAREAGDRGRPGRLSVWSGRRRCSNPWFLLWAMRPRRWFACMNWCRRGD